jgi:hypothetical protein
MHVKHRLRLGLLYFNILFVLIESRNIEHSKLDGNKNYQICSAFKFMMNIVFICYRLPNFHISERPSSFLYVMILSVL